MTDDMDQLRDKILQNLDQYRTTPRAADGKIYHRISAPLPTIVDDIPDPSYITDEESPQSQIVVSSEPKSSDLFSLRPYQSEAVAKIIGMQGKVILAYTMGTGKTGIALRCLPHLLLGLSDISTLVVCPKIAFGTWESEIDNWLADKYYVTFTGDEGQRHQRWRDFKSSRTDFLITNYEQMENVLALKKNWGAIIIDEAHKLKNRKTKGFELVKKFQSDNVLLLTGSPIVNGVEDLWTLLHLLNRKQFGSYWEFVNTHCIVIKDHWGVKIAGVRDPAKTKEVIKPYLIRKTKDQVLKDLPPKIRQAVPLIIEGEQYALYQQIAKEMIAELDEDEFLLTPNKISQMTRLRQILVSPALVGGPDKSAVFEAIRESVEEDFAQGRSAIVFTPFAKALPLLEQRLGDLCDFITTIRGGMKTGEPAKRVKAFQEHSSKKCILLCSLLVGSSFTATKAQTVHFAGYDWTPANCYQAEDRAHRIGQKGSVLVKYYINKGTIDDYIMSVLNRKTSWSRIVLDKGFGEVILPKSDV